MGDSGSNPGKLDPNKLKAFEGKPSTAPKLDPVTAPGKLDKNRFEAFKEKPPLPLPPKKPLTGKGLVEKEKQLQDTVDGTAKKADPIKECPIKHPEIDVDIPTEFALQPVREYAGGKAPVEQLITVRSTGEADLVVASVVVSGANSAEFIKLEDQATGATIKPGESKTFKVKFDPTEEGARTATFRVTSNARTEPQVNRDLLGTAGVPKIKVTPNPVDFLVFIKTKKSPALPVTIESTGTVDLTLSGLAVSEAVEGQYTGTQPVDWNKPLAPGASITYPLVFEAKKEGAHTGKVEVKSNAQGAATVNVDLKAKVFGIQNPDNKEFIAAGHETVELKYEVLDEGTAITKGKFEIFDKKKALVFTRPLEAKEYKHGPVTMEFKGEIAPSTAGYPDDCLTVEHSPYMWKVTVEADHCADTAFVEKAIKVEMHSIELELGEKAALVKTRHQTAFDTLSGALPAKGGKTKLKLNSNIFQTGNAQMLHNALKDFDQYNSMDEEGVGATYEGVWGEGPLVPVFAKLWVKDSGGAKKEAPKALGEVPVLWDYKEADKDLSNLHPQAKEFVKNAQDYEKASTLPKGDNCATHFGGKRGNPSSPVFLAAHDVAEITAFPFAAAEAAATRTWAAHTRPLRAGPKVSKTGVMFRPSRMAGDSYIVHAYVDIDKQLDKLADPPDSLHDYTGTFEIWRQIDITKIYRKNGNVAVYSHAGVVDQYDRAFVEMRDLSGGPAVIPNHNARFSAAITRQGTQNVKDGILANHAIVNKAANLSDGSDAAIAMKSYDDFYNSYIAAETDPGKFAAYKLTRSAWVATQKAPPISWSDIQVDNALRIELRDLAINALTAQGLWDASAGTRKTKYETACKAFSYVAAIRACNDAVGDTADDGIQVFHFDWTDNYGGKINGVALHTAYHNGTNRLTRNRTGYLQAAPPRYYTGQKSMDQTVAHELGHCIFLPHTQFEPGNVEDADAHDLSDDRCLMCYNFDRVRRFCGFCLLRLRGWRHDDTRLLASGANARKPKLEVTIDPASFEAVEPNKTWVDAKIILVNGHDQPLTISDITPGGANQGEYTLTGLDAAKAEHAAGATIEIGVKFAPTAGGGRVLTLTVASNHATKPSQVITITSNGTKFDVTVADGPFAGSAPRSAVTKILQVKNTGQAPLALTGFQLTGDHAADYAVVDADAALTTVAVGATADLKVKVTPSAPGARKATLEIASTDPDSPKKVVLHTLGEKPAIAVAPDPLAFGNILQPASKTLKLRLSNTSTQSLTIDKIVLEGPCCADVVVGAGVPCTIAPGGSTVEVDVTFNGASKGFALPNKTEADKTATLKVLSNAPTSPNSVPITARVQMAELSFSSATDFGSRGAMVAGEIATGNLNFKNTGNGDLHITGPVTLAGDLADWEVTDLPNGAGTFPITVAAGVTYTAKLKFKPQTAGNKQIVLTPATDAPGNVPTHTAKGVGVAKPISTLSTPGPIAIGNVVQGTKSGVVTVTITNSGLADLTVNSVTAGGMFGQENAVGGGAPIAPGATMSFDVFFQPTALGPQNGTITIASNSPGSPQTINVTGTGVNP